MNSATANTIVITGAAGGLGRALALEAYARGCALALLDVDKAGLQEVKSLCTGAALVTLHEVDVADEAAVKTAVDEIVLQHTSVTMLINNAGISISCSFESVGLPDFRRLMEVNFWGAVYCTRYLLPVLKQYQGRVVNITSDFALLGFPGKTTYGASKGALSAFTQALYAELQGTEVSVSLVIPPPMDTGLVQHGQHVAEDKRKEEMQFLQRNGMPLPEAARRIWQAVHRGRFRIVVGRFMFWVDLASRLFPVWVHRLVARRRNRIRFY